MRALACAVGPFDVLDVDRDADDKTVEAQYRDIAKLVHPDKGGSDEAFRRLHEAFESLSTQAGRTEQDRAAPLIPHAGVTRARREHERLDRELRQQLLECFMQPRSSRTAAGVDDWCRLRRRAVEAHDAFALVCSLL